MKEKKGNGLRMKLTCVTATFNCVKAGNRERLIRCVESVARLKTEHEHLIYDGASSDGTVELLRDLEARISGVKVVSEPDTGIYNALNKGVRDAKGEWFYVLGADDYLCKPEVMDAILVKCSGGGVDMIVSPVKKPIGGIPVNLANTFCFPPYCHQGVVMKTALLHEFGGFDERYRICADYDLLLKIHKARKAVCYIDSSFAFFYGEGASCDPVGLFGDIDLVVSKHLALNSKETVRLRIRHCPPIGKMLPYIFDKDKALRIGARAMVKVWVMNVLRVVLWPVVLLRRRIRSRTEGK